MGINAQSSYAALATYSPSCGYYARVEGISLNNNNGWGGSLWAGGGGGEREGRSENSKPEGSGMLTAGQEDRVRLIWINA